MADIAAFRGIRYSNAGDLASLTSPPYDVISPEERDELARSDEHNVVRLILPSDDGNDSDGESQDKYTRAAETLSAWLSSGALRTDERESLYVYEQSYSVGAHARVQRGVLAAVSLDEESVLPHEKTMAAPVSDRLSLMRSTQANLEPILCVYSGEEGAGRDAIAAAVEGPPLAAFSTTSDGVGHKLWAIDDRSSISAVRDALAPVRLVIADGHHRHRTAQEYRDERRARDGAGPWDRMLMMLLDAEWAGPSLLAIHRTVDGVDAQRAHAALSGVFEVESASTRDVVALEDELARRRESARTYVMLDATRAWWLTLADKEAANDAMPADRSAAWRDLDVAVLHSLVFERLLHTQPGYVHSAREADDALRSGGATLAFLLAATPFDAVRRVAENREAMPPKSTYFYPKPRTGVVLRSLR